MIVPCYEEEKIIKVLIKNYISQKDVVRSNSTSAIVIKSYVLSLRRGA